MITEPPGEPATWSQIAAGAVGIVVEDQGRAHRAARPLTRLHAIGDGGAVGAEWIGGEVGELVVQHESVDEMERSEGRFDRGGHRGGIAVLIDDRDMAGAVLGRLRADTEWHRAEIARLRGAHAVAGIDETGALLQIVLVQQGLR